MLQITNEYKEQVKEALLGVRDNFDGTDSQFSKQWGINNSVFSQLKNGMTDRLLRDSQWLTIGRELDVQLHSRKWKMAKTEVFKVIEEDVRFCQDNAKKQKYV
ncbi:hypothetical protein ACFFJX_27775 [Pseudarcicella hirudinis]|uniref:hypothetical protein n=1 Tax=Pseudarcicella hirudinis TaxID=1079859 RepID=UPI0035ED1DBA